MTMVSVMESISDHSLQEQLREAERGQAAPWISYPPVPWWYAPAFGVWAATYTLTQAVPDTLWRTLLQLVHVVAMLGAVALMRRWRGTYPRGRAPRELRGSFALLVLGALVVVGAVVLVTTTLGTVAAAVAAFLLATLLVSVYERRYAAAAARVRERLG